MNYSSMNPSRSKKVAMIFPLDIMQLINSSLNYQNDSLEKSNYNDLPPENDTK